MELRTKPSFTSWLQACRVPALFKSAHRLRDDLTTAECQGYLDRVNIDRTELPEICKAETRRLREPGLGFAIRATAGA
jgi:hypothetical protein